MANSAKLLDVVNMPLQGRHLIEASAGTGKTFNITRLYLRLLLEKKLNVKEILVMTFTKAATEEIKGRVAKTLREATLIWQQAKDNGNVIDDSCDEVYQHLFHNNDIDESLSLLQAAQLELDEASVFTIHGFCQHVIAQMAFNSGFAMTLNLGNDTSELYLEAAEDYIRQISANEEDFLLLAQSGWHVPERLLSDFNSSIRSTLTPVLLTEERVVSSFFDSLNSNPETALSNFGELLQSIEENEQLIHEQLIKTPAHKKERPQELEALKAWLNACNERQQYDVAPAQAHAFLDGRRYARNKSGVKELLTPIKTLAKEIDTAVQERDAALAQIPVFELINNAISFIKQRVVKQKKQLGLIDFDDLIRMLADEVVKPDNTLVPQLRKRFPVALIDEFQDTDANQYAILDAVYPNQARAIEQQTPVSDLPSSYVDQHLEGTSSALLMIGDPKQAIYRFRGGDIFTYLKAGRQADYRWVMNTNWRSVEGMVKAYNRLFYGAPIASNEPEDVFGFNIQYTPVEFTPKAAAAKTPLIDKHNERSAMNYVSMHLQDKQDATAMRRSMAQWIAQEVYRLLNEAHFVSAESEKNTDKPSPETASIEQAVRPADIAILVKDRTEANIIKYVFQQKGLSSVYLSDRSNLFASAEAKDVLRLLSGIWHASDTRKVASSLASSLWGYSPQTLITLLYQEDDALWDEAFERVLTLRDMWLQKGCMSVLLHLLQSSYVPHGNDVERALTNYQHLAEVLEKASTTHPRPEQLLDWLNKQIHQPDSDEELTLRLESDSQLIRIITQHGSKGLEYPIVFVPFATGYKDAARNGKSLSHIFTYFDEEKGDLQLQLGQTKQAIARVRAEGEAEDMRLAYVAVTRAAHRCYMGVLPLDGNEKSALGRAMGLGKAAPGTDDAITWEEALTALDSEEHAYVSHIDADDFQETYSSFDETCESATLSVQQFTGTASEYWRLYSFSALSRLTQKGLNTPNHQSELPHESSAEASVANIPVVQTQRDEEFYQDLSNVGYQPDINVVDNGMLRFTLEKGASAGNLLHDLLEHNDFSAPEWEETGSELVTRFGLSEQDTPRLYDWLDEVLQTPLFPDLQLSLSDLPLNKTLREAEFYFPMNESRWQGLKSVLNAHRSALAKQLDADALTTPNLLTSSLEGMMHGFIDLIFEHDGKYYVADYKSTWLGDTIQHYTPAALFENNQHHLYDLQYLIYGLALHRYLKQSLPEYKPSMHFGGVYYLYLRGMHPDNENGEGVFFTSITENILNALDKVFSSDDAKENETGLSDNDAIDDIKPNMNVDMGADTENCAATEDEKAKIKLQQGQTLEGSMPQMGQQSLFDDEWE